jgi:hypothetical protein
MDLSSRSYILVLICHLYKYCISIVTLHNNICTLLKGSRLGEKTFSLFSLKVPEL